MAPSAKALLIALLTTAGVALLLVFGLTGQPQSPAADTKKDDLTVIYVGAEDCAPCQVWQRDHWPAFAASPIFAALEYREVKAPRLSEMLNGEYWPSDLLVYRDRHVRLAGVPMWLVIHDGEVAFTAFGLGQWKSAALPRITGLAN